MTNSITELSACTNEQLDQMLADVLTKARAQLLNDAEVHAFWWVHDEIPRRRARPDTAAKSPFLAEPRVVAVGQA
jgi:hypothetical protein